MTVAELIEILKKEDQDATVLLSRDPEGNGFAPWAGISREKYIKSGLTIDLVYDSTAGRKALVLWP